MSAPAAAKPAGDTVAGALDARYPGLSPGECGLLETAIPRQLAVTAGRDCALAVTPQPDGTLHIGVLFIGRATGP